jgi:hypothetical protein
MVSEGGTFVVPVKINDQITLNFVVDSGASGVAVPADVVSTLVRTGIITDADFLGKQTYRFYRRLARTFVLPAPRVPDWLPFGEQADSKAPTDLIPDNGQVERMNRTIKDARAALPGKRF